MAYLTQENLTVTTTAGGAAATTTLTDFTGFLQAINYVVDGTNPYSNSVVITITGNTSGLTLLSITLASNISTVWYPRAATQSTLGVASLFTTGAAFAVTDKLPLAGERILVTLSAGGATKLGAFRFIVGG